MDLLESFFKRSMFGQTRTRVAQASRSELVRKLAMSKTDITVFLSSVPENRDRQPFKTWQQFSCNCNSRATPMTVAL